MGTVLMVALVALIVAAIAYGFVALRVMAKKVGIDLKEATKTEIDRIVIEAIDCAEEWARAQKILDEKIVQSSDKLKLAIGRAKMFLKNVSDDEIKTMILTKLGTIRRWSGDIVEDLADEIRGE